MGTCSDANKTTAAECVATCSDTSLTTEATCLYEEVNSGAPNANLALTLGECTALAGGSLASTNSWTTYPSGCHKVGAATYIFNTNGDSTVNCGETVDSYVRTCVQKSGDTWTPRTWTAREWGTAYGTHAIGDINLQECTNTSHLTEADCIAPIYSYTANSSYLFEGTSCSSVEDCVEKCDASATCAGYTSTCSDSSLADTAAACVDSCSGTTPQNGYSAAAATSAPRRLLPSPPGP